ncbi:MAG: ABC transporter substrate-binding protein [Candidatus Hydrogenedentes bacterium]|nr:ABC transporter substrate-binding protein [Candidatus Hydrogenedentota bacterium]
MSTALSGPTAYLGINMRAGVEAALAEANRAGGVRGRTLRLISLDDGYEPTRTVPNMHALIDREEVLAIIGNVGTPTAVVAIPIAIESGTPFVAALSGGGALRKTPPDRVVINFRASYGEEIRAMIDALVRPGGLRPEEVAFFTQRDAFGDAGFHGGIEALKERGLKDVRSIVHARYERNSLAVEGGLADLLLSEPPPRAVIIVGTYAPCIEFIRLARHHGLNALLLTMSFVGSQPVCEALGPLAEGVVVTQVLPHYDSDVPIAPEYHRALEAYAPDMRPSFRSFEGYVATRMFLLALGSIDGKPTKGSVITALEGLGQFDLGVGEPLSLGPGDHQACDRTWPNVIMDGKVVPCSWDDLISFLPAAGP